MTTRTWKYYDDYWNYYDYGYRYDHKNLYYQRIATVMILRGTFRTGIAFPAF